MAIKIKKDVININDELNKELESFGFSISFDNKEEKKDKKEKKTTKNK